VTEAVTAAVTGLFLPIKVASATAPEANLVVQPELSRELGRPAKQRPVTVTATVAFTIEMAVGGPQQARSPAKSGAPIAST
jgi:hypothetical protein